MERPNKVKERLERMQFWWKDNQDQFRSISNNSWNTFEYITYIFNRWPESDLYIYSRKNPFFILIVSCCVAHIHSIKSVDYSS